VAVVMRMAAETTPKFSLELARAALVKAEADSQSRCLNHQYTADQIIEIERRISAVRQCAVAIGEKPRFS
jgi:hypothetical protein